MLPTKKKKKRWLRWLMTGIVIFAIGYMLQQLLNQHFAKPVTGNLYFETTSGCDTIGDFVVSWFDGNDAYISIATTDNPQKILWQTPKGEQFVATGRGGEIVNEARGMFTIREKLLQIYDNQTVTKVIRDTNFVSFEGRLYPANPEVGVSYVLRFQQAPDSAQLQIQVEVAQPSFNRVFVTYMSSADEHFFGFGTQFTHFDMKGLRVPIFISEQGIGRGKEPLTTMVNFIAGAGGNEFSSYACVPHYISSQMRSLFLENYEYSQFDFSLPDRVQVKVFASSFNARLLKGNTPQELITNYTQYAGRMRPLPDWITNGAVIGMQGGTDKVEKIYNQLKEHEVPVSAFWLQDWVGQRTTSFGKQLWWNWLLNRQHYPRWKNLVETLQHDSVRVMTYINPFLVEVDSLSGDKDLFSQANDSGLFVNGYTDEVIDLYFFQIKKDTTYFIRNTDFSAAMLDLSNHYAREWIKNIMDTSMIQNGSSGWMADFGEALPYDALLGYGDAKSWHNRYAEEWAQLNRELIDSSDNGNDKVFFCRSGYTRSPRYATLFWLGDQLVTWDQHDGIKTAVTGLLTSGLSGYAFNHSDIGGYTAIIRFPFDYRRSNELLQRWMELNAFSVVFRTHEGNKPDENEQFYSSDQNMQHFNRCARLYRSWNFYRRQLIAEAAKSGLPVVRHPFIHYPSDQRFWNNTYQQFMVGTEIMVVPVLDEGVQSVNAYLPAGEWIHLWTGKEYQSEKGIDVTIQAPLGQPAVFYRKNSPITQQWLANIKQEGL